MSIKCSTIQSTDFFLHFQHFNYELNQKPKYQKNVFGILDKASKLKMMCEYLGEIFKKIWSYYIIFILYFKIKINFLIIIIFLIAKYLIKITHSIVCKNSIFSNNEGEHKPLLV